MEQLYRLTRKLADLGYSRSANKCKEKFANVCKYHKKMKEQATKLKGKAYRFSNQLEALDIYPSPPPLSIEKVQIPMVTTVTSVAPPDQTETLQISINPSSFQHINASDFNSTCISSGSTIGEKSGNRKRKWSMFFENLMEEVVRKQEICQSKFLKTLEQLEQERMAREETWKMQALERIKKEHKILVQERLAAATRNASIVTLMEKLCGLHNTSQLTDGSLAPENLVNTSEVDRSQSSNKKSSERLVDPLESDSGQDFNRQSSEKVANTVELDNCPSFNEKNSEKFVKIPEPDIGQSSIRKRSKKLVNTPESDNDRHPIKKTCSRWPKADVQALIMVRSTLERLYQGNMPKGSMWKEISIAMKRLGYDRSAKRCKEKWENINKYFKKVKDSNKIRPEESITCSYFSQLEARYKEKTNRVNNSLDSCYGLKGEDLITHMVRQSQLQPQSLEQEQTGPSSTTEDPGSEKDDQYYEEEDGINEVRNHDGDAGDGDENLSNCPSSTADAE